MSAAAPTLAVSSTAAASAASVSAALNLGWSMAELRGRIRYGHAAIPGPSEYQFPREIHALPLGGEHSAGELLITTRIAVLLLAEDLGLDQALDGVPDVAPQVKPLAKALEDALKKVEKGVAAERWTAADVHPPGSAVAEAWSAAADAIYRWDEQLQDRLAVSVELLSAYQLGRGLSEAFWALDPAVPLNDPPDDPPRPGSWEFLLGPRRRDLLLGHLQRLEVLLPPFTIPAVHGPLCSWCDLVSSGQVRSYVGAAAALREQLQVWRDILLGSRNPASLANRPGIKVGARQLLRVLQTFFFETAVSVISIAALAFSGYELAANSERRAVAVLVSVLGFFGVTSSALLAWAKSQAREAIQQLRQAFYADVVSERAARLPAGATPKRIKDG